MSESDSYPKAEFFRKPNLSKNLPNVPKCGLNTRHDNREVTWQLFNFSESRICPNICRMFRSVDWTDDMIIVKWHLFIWHERNFCALTNAPQVQSTQTGQWLSTLFHANCSAAQVYVLYPRQFIFVLSCRRDHFCRYYNPQSARNDILKHFFCIWWWQMLRSKHILTRKL